jgi:hypothetical protein
LRCGFCQSPRRNRLQSLLLGTAFRFNPLCKNVTQETERFLRTFSVTIFAAAVAAENPEQKIKRQKNQRKSDQRKPFWLAFFVFIFVSPDSNWDAVKNANCCP